MYALASESNLHLGSNRDDRADVIDLALSGILIGVGARDENQMSLGNRELYLSQPQQRADRTKLKAPRAPRGLFS